jgi:nucleoside-diphosphate-sugar epimerase
MSKNLLITGLNNQVDLRLFNDIIKKKYNLTIIIGSNTPEFNKEHLEENKKIIKLDLAKIESLKNFLSNNHFDIIVHNSELRDYSTRKFSKKRMFDFNINATEQFINHSLEYQSKFIYFSTIDVFGVRPIKLPLDEQSERVNDSFYHLTKNRAEIMIQNYVLKGLNSVIIRTSYMYGNGLPGIINDLLKLLRKHLLFITKEDVFIQMTHIDLFIQTILKAIDSEIKPGTIINALDPQPVKIQELVDLIYQIYLNRNLPLHKTLGRKKMEIYYKLAHFLKLNKSIEIMNFLMNSKYFSTETQGIRLTSKQVDTLTIWKHCLESLKK